VFVGLLIFFIFNPWHRTLVKKIRKNQHIKPAKDAINDKLAPFLFHMHFFVALGHYPSSLGYVSESHSHKNFSWKLSLSLSLSLFVPSCSICSTFTLPSTYQCWLYNAPKTFPKFVTSRVGTSLHTYNNFCNKNIYNII
jgi:hypothetical protein